MQENLFSVRKKNTNGIATNKKTPGKRHTIPENHSQKLFSHNIGPKKPKCRILGLFVQEELLVIHGQQGKHQDELSFGVKKHTRIGNRFFRSQERGYPKAFQRGAQVVRGSGWRCGRNRSWVRVRSLDASCGTIRPGCRRQRARKSRQARMRAR